MTTFQLRKLIREEVRKIISEEQMPKVLFHSVRDEKTKEYILRNGIKADDMDMVYLSKKPMGGIYKFTFEVEVPDETKLHDWRDVWEDGYDKEYDVNNPYFIYEGDIPKQYVKLI